MNNKVLQELFAPGIPQEELKNIYAEMSENESDGGYNIIDVSETPSIPEAILKVISAEISENDPTRSDFFDTSELIAQGDAASPFKKALDNLDILREVVIT